MGAYWYQYCRKWYGSLNVKFDMAAPYQSDEIEAADSQENH